MAFETYNPSDFGEKEVALRNTFYLQMNDARNYFLNVIKPRLDRSYKLYIAYTGDRQREIKKWQSNVFVPYIMSVVETLMPRILDARPEFTVQGRSSDDQLKTEKQQQLADYNWEIAKMDATSEVLVRSCLVYGTGYLQVSWKKDVRKYKFLDTKDLLSKKYKYSEKERVFYDAPYCEWVDNYSLWYDWHNTARENKQYWFKRLVLTEPEIRRRYPLADKKRLQMAMNSVGGDLNDYASIRQLVKSNHQLILKGMQPITSYRGFGDDKYNVYGDPKLRMYEVFEWWRPFEDSFTVMVGNNYVPIFKGGDMPIPYDFKEAPFIEVPYLKMPNEFEGYGIPMILENPQIMLNLIKNQRLDSATLSIHKMWIVNPLANINKEELVTRPFGIIYSIDPNGVREVQFSDIKQSAYREEDLLKQDMRYSSGVDDFSMGVGGAAGSATEVRHLRESTLERVRLFVNHLGDAFSDVLRYWMDMQRQFFTQKMQIRVLGKDGKVAFPLIEKDDLMGKFDYKASVLPSIAGQNDVKKKQDMDLFQLLISLPFVDPKKLTAKVLTDFGWNLEGITAPEQGEQPPVEGEQPAGTEGMMPPGAEGQIPPEMMGAMPPEGAAPTDLSAIKTGSIPPNVLIDALKIMGGSQAVPGPANNSPFSEASSPINLLQGGNPPTVKGAPASGGGPGYRYPVKTTNYRGLNKTGKPNTNDLNINGKSNPESSLMRSVNNLQR
jgi:hypothetical protein